MYLYNRKKNRTHTDNIFETTHKEHNATTKSQPQTVYMFINKTRLNAVIMEYDGK